MCAIVKGVYVIQLRQQDFYYNGIDVTIWTAVETATAIIAASIPVLRVFFKEKVSTLSYNHGGSKDVHLSRLNRHSRRLGNTSRVETVRRDKDNDWVTLGSIEDVGSDRSILDDARGDGVTDKERSVSSVKGILATSVVTIDYDEEKVEWHREKMDRTRSGVAI